MPLSIHSASIPRGGPTRPLTEKKKNHRFLCLPLSAQSIFVHSLETKQYKQHSFEEEWYPVIDTGVWKMLSPQLLLLNGILTHFINSV